MRAERCRTLLSILGWAAALLALAGCSVAVATPGPAPTRFVTPTNPYAPVRILRQNRAAGIQLPGAERIGTGSGEREPQLLMGRWQFGEITTLLGTQATVPEVFAYYDRELRAAGYAFVPNGAARATTELDAWGWCTPAAAYRLSIQDQARAFDPKILGGRTYATVYIASLIGRDGSPCPQ